MTPYLTRSTKNAEKLVIPDIQNLSAPTGNIFKTIEIITKRSKQLSLRSNQTFRQDMENVLSGQDEDEDEDEVARRSRLRERISIKHEQKEQPVLVATKEFLQDKLAYRYPGEDSAHNT